MDDDPHIQYSAGTLLTKGQNLGSDASAPPSGGGDAARSSPTHRSMPEFSDLVLACRYRLPLSLLAGLFLSTALVFLAWRLNSAMYEAKSLVHVRQRQEVVFTPQTSPAEDAAFVRDQQQLVVSPPVLAAALADSQFTAYSDYLPAHNAVEWLQTRVRVDVQPGAEMLSISVQHASPRVAQALCNAVTGAYLKQVTNSRAADRQRRREELERATRDADQRLDQMWENLNSIATDVGSDSSESLTIRDEIQLQAYREYAQQLRRAQLRVNELQGLLTEEQVKAAGGDETLAEAIDQQLRNHPDIIAAQDQLNKVDARIARLRDVSADNESPKLKSLNEEREQLVKSLERVKTELRPQILEMARQQRRADCERAIAQLRRQIELQEAEKTFLHGRMEEIDTTIVRTDKKNGVQLEVARHAVDRQTRLADALSQSLEEFKIESQCQIPVALIQWAELPREANRSRQLKAAGSAAGLGWLVAILGVGTLEWRARRIRSARDVLLHSTRPVFGTHASGHGLLQLGRDRSSGGASEAAARLMLCRHAGDGAVIPSVMVSSAWADEPRHQVALDLARAFCGFHCRTLLVDADVSGVSLSREVGAAHFTGLTQVTPRHPDARPYIVSTAEETLDFLPLGVPQGATAWVDPATLRSVLSALRSDYDAIVVNGPAIMSDAESLLLAAEVDQTLLAVFPGTSRWNDLAATEEMAAQAGLAVFGSVLHTGHCAATMKLRWQGSRATSRATENIEEGLQESVAAMQREFGQVASSTALKPAECTHNTERTS
jgi:Mrp family chromosome partitioning ATPase